MSAEHCLNRKFNLLYPSLSQSCRRLRGFSYEIRNISPPDFETEERQMLFHHPVPAGTLFIRQLRWTEQRPIEITPSKNSFHFGCIGHHTGEEQAADQIGWGKDRGLAWRFSTTIHLP